jgi:hypothetical protein
MKKTVNFYTIFPSKKKSFETIFFLSAKSFGFSSSKQICAIREEESISYFELIFVSILKAENESD